MIISTISGGKIRARGEPVRGSEFPDARAPVSFALERRHTALTKSLITGIGY